jgi:ADP-heptose:LPS heptosyltransferase
MFDIRLMRQIDNQVGNAVCSVLAAAKKLRPTRVDRAGSIRKIAVAKFFGMGSLVVASPSIQALREAYPGVEIHFITFASNREILDILGGTDRRWFIDNSSASAFTLSTYEVARGLRREKIDLLVDFEFFAKFPLVLGGVAGIPRSAGFCLTPEPWRKTLLDVPGSYNHYYHTKDIFLSLVYLLKTQDLYYLGFDEFRRRYTYPRMTVDPAHVADVRRLLGAHGATGRRLVVVNPNTSPELAPEVRKWPEERYAELTQRVLSEYADAHVVFIGAKADRAYVERIVQRVGSPRATSVAGELDLRRLLALFSIADLFVSNDSGPMHLACLVDTPVIGLFFADTPTLFAPLASRARCVAPDLYSLPLFTVYNGKDAVAGKPIDVISNVPARTVPVERVMTEVHALLPKVEQATQPASSRAV